MTGTTRTLALLGATLLALSLAACSGPPARVDAGRDAGSSRRDAGAPTMDAGQPASDAGPSTVCGDSVCADSERCTCAADCGEGSCGDGVCCEAHGESAAT